MNNIKKLPSWLQELWISNPTIARQAEKYLTNRENEIVADIRNKLTPSKNLCALIKIKNDKDVEKFIELEVKNVENSIDYLKDLKIW